MLRSPQNKPPAWLAAYNRDVLLALRPIHGSPSRFVAVVGGVNAKCLWVLLSLLCEKVNPVRCQWCVLFVRDSCEASCRLGRAVKAPGVSFLAFRFSFIDTLGPLFLMRCVFDGFSLKPATAHEGSDSAARNVGITIFHCSVEFAVEQNVSQVADHGDLTRRTITSTLGAWGSISSHCLNTFLSTP